MSTLQNDFNSCLYHASSALHRWLGRIADEYFNMVDLTPTQGFMLITLKQAPGITVKVLSEVLQLDQSTITKTLDKMKGKGLIQRELEGRTVMVFATDRGLKKEADARSAWRKLQLAYGKIIGAPEAKMMAAAITKALDQLRKELP
jgi:MarR family transcriptional regulator, organic hydroperoxide resistance regulator